MSRFNLLLSMKMDEHIDRADLQKALETLKKGGTILYPTDTIWGIGGDATNTDTIAEIYKIKGREEGKSMLILLENENQLSSYVQDIPDVAYQLIEYSERPLTIIYDGAKNLPDNLIGPDKTIGIRIVKHPFCQALIQRFRKPIVSTSANISGRPSPSTYQDIADEIKEQVDYVVQFGEYTEDIKQPSIIMRLESTGRFEFLRK